MLDRRIIERVAGRLSTDEGLIEKDWHIVRALSALASLNNAVAPLVFSGGTSLSKGWGLIKRFSEDIDFKVSIPPTANGAESRNQRRAFRKQALSVLTANEFELIGKPESGNESQYFAANLAFQSHFTTGHGLRPHIRIEMSFYAPALKPVERPIRSLIAQSQNLPAEISGFPCVDPIETAADKLSALAWRVCTRKRGAEGDDPTMIRHLHDLAALEAHIKEANEFPVLVRQTAANDSGRGGGAAPSDPIERFDMMLNLLSGSKAWATEYDTFVLKVSFARPEEKISFSDALSAVTRLVKMI